MSELKTKLEAIKSEKDSKILSENIKSGVTIFGVEGDSNIVNTQTSAAAIASEIEENKEVFVNGKKITGTKGICKDNESCYFIGTGQNNDPEKIKATYVKKGTMGNNEDGYVDLTYKCNFEGAAMYKVDAKASIGAKTLASAIELTPDKIVEGNTILEIEGTGKKDVSFEEEEEYAELLALSKQILGEE